MGSMESKKTPTIEENFARLDEMIEKMESQDIPLEEAFQLYTEGMALLKTCNTQLDKVEKQVLKLSEDGVLEKL